MNFSDLLIQEYKKIKKEKSDFETQKKLILEKDLYLRKKEQELLNLQNQLEFRQKELEKKQETHKLEEIKSNAG